MVYVQLHNAQSIKHANVLTGKNDFLAHGATNSAIVIYNDVKIVLGSDIVYLRLSKNILKSKNFVVELVRSYNIIQEQMIDPCKVFLLQLINYKTNCKFETLTLSVCSTIFIIQSLQILHLQSAAHSIETSAAPPTHPTPVTQSHACNPY